MTVRRFCGVRSHPPLTVAEQAELQYWDGADMIQEISPGERSSFSDVDRILQIHSRIGLFEYKPLGRELSQGQRILHDAFAVPTLAEVMHVVFSDKEGARYGLSWLLMG